MLAWVCALRYICLLTQDHVQKAKFEVMGDKFSTHYDAVEEQLKSTTIGMVKPPVDDSLPDPSHCVTPRHRSGHSGGDEREEGDFGSRERDSDSC